MNVRSPFIHERFWSRVNVTVNIRCWQWLGRKDENGYGQVRINGKTMRAPRVAFWLRNGKWPNNACHTCDNPVCCNPNHIFDGTRSDNMRDMVSKGRNKTRIGEQHGRSVLTDQKVLDMRSNYRDGGISLESLAKKYGCSFSTAQRVIKRHNWKHLP